MLASSVMIAIPILTLMDDHQSPGTMCFLFYFYVHQDTEAGAEDKA